MQNGMSNGCYVWHSNRQRDLTSMKDGQLFEHFKKLSGYFIFVIDESNSILWYNESAKKFFGKSLMRSKLHSLFEVDENFFQKSTSGSIRSKIKKGKREILFEHRIISSSPKGMPSLKIVISEDKTDDFIFEDLKDSLFHFDSLISKLALESINIPASDTDTQIGKILSLIKNFSAADRVFVSIIKNNGYVYFEYDCCDSDFTPTIDCIKSEYLPSVLKRIKKDDIILISDVTKIKYHPNTSYRDVFSDGVVSAVIIPLGLNKLKFGYLGFVSKKKITQLTPFIEAIIKVSGELITNLYEKKKTYGKYEIASMIVSKSSGMLAYFDANGFIKSTSESFDSFFLQGSKGEENILNFFSKAMGSDPGSDKFFYDIKSSMSGQMVKTEFWFKKDDDIRLIEASFHPDFGDNGVKGVVMSASDITERVQLETKILEVMHNERKRVGISLHDELGHDLLAVAIKSRLLSDRLRPISTELSSEILDIEKSIRICIDKVRELSHGLIPYKNYGLEFTEMIDAVSLIISKNCDVRCIFDIDPDIDIQDEHVIKELYYIIEESVMNAIKHSGCSEIKISMFRNKDNITVRISDNGKGFLFREGDLSGAGLEIMRYRARSICGTLTINRNSDGGTSVECSFLYNKSN